MAVIVENAGFGGGRGPIARRVLDYLLLGQYPSEEDILAVQQGKATSPIGTPRRAAEVPLPRGLDAFGDDVSGVTADAALASPPSVCSAGGFSGPVPVVSAAPSQAAASAPAPGGPRHCPNPACRPRQRLFLPWSDLRRLGRPMKVALDKPSWLQRLKPVFEGFDLPFDSDCAVHVWARLDQHVLGGFRPWHTVCRSNPQHAAGGGLVVSGCAGASPAADCLGCSAVHGGVVLLVATALFGITKKGPRVGSMWGWSFSPLRNPQDRHALDAGLVVSAAAKVSCARLTLPLPVPCWWCRLALVLKQPDLGTAMLIPVVRLVCHLLCWLELAADLAGVDRGGGGHHPSSWSIRPICANPM